MPPWVQIRGPQVSNLDRMRPDRLHIKAGEPSRSPDVKALRRSDFLCHGQTPFSPICILVLRPLSSWLRRALHTMGMEGSFGQRSGKLQPAQTSNLLQTRVTLETLMTYSRQSIPGGTNQSMQHFGCNRDGGTGLGKECPRHKSA